MGTDMNRIEIKYRPPHPYPLPTDPRIDPGGYVYAIYQDGRKRIGGTSGGLDKDKALRNAKRAAAQAGIEVPDENITWVTTWESA